MNPEKIYDVLMEALADEKIRSELTEIIGRKTADERIDGQTELFPETDISALSAENASLSRKIALLELEMRRLENDKDNLITKNQIYSETLNMYCGAFGAQISLYEKYRNLSPQTAKVMNGFFKNNTMAGIFMCGILPENLSGVRDYTESLVINDYEGKKNDIAILNELYTFLISCYNSTFQNPAYSIMTVNAGDEFDERLHHNIGTAKSGRISEVLMQGCISAANGKVIRKTIVRM